MTGFTSICLRGEAARPGICSCIRFEVCSASPAGCSATPAPGLLSFGDKRSRLPAVWALERVPSGLHNSISESLWKGLFNTDDLHQSSGSAGLLPIAPIAIFIYIYVCVYVYNYICILYIDIIRFNAVGQLLPVTFPPSCSQCRRSEGHITKAPFSSSTWISPSNWYRAKAWSTGSTGGLRQGLKISKSSKIFLGK